MTTIDHQQAAIQAGAKALAEHQIGEDWGDDGVTFIGCDCGQWFGKRVNDGEELARTHEAQAALTAAMPHIRAQIAAEIRVLMIDPAESNTPHCIEEYNNGLTNAVKIVEGTQT